MFLSVVMTGLASTTSNNGQMVDVAVLSFAEQFHFPRLDATRHAAVGSARTLASTIFNPRLRLAPGVRVGVRVSEH